MNKAAQKAKKLPPPLKKKSQKLLFSPHWFVVWDSEDTKLADAMSGRTDYKENSFCFQ